MTRDIELVVARYKEDLSWASSVSHRVTVYNKFEGDNLLPNVGRESHTYLTHIVSNYDDLADFTVFVQGDPLAHCKNFLRLMSDEAFLKRGHAYAGLSDGLITCDGNGRPHCGKEHLPIAKLYEYLFEEKAPEVFVCNSAGQFGVSRETVRRNSREFYERALETLAYDSNPIEGFCMERMWTCLFGFKSFAKRTSIQYFGDSNIDVDEYLRQTVASDGSFVCLGDLGFKRGRQ